MAGHSYVGVQPARRASSELAPPGGAGLPLRSRRHARALGTRSRWPRLVLFAPTSCHRLGSRARLCPGPSAPDSRAVFRRPVRVRAAAAPPFPNSPKTPVLAALRTPEASLLRDATHPGSRSSSPSACPSLLRILRVERPARPGRRATRAMKRGGGGHARDRESLRRKGSLVTWSKRTNSSSASTSAKRASP